MTEKILYKSSVGRDLKHIDSKNRDRLLAEIRTLLSESPRLGEPLHGEFSGLYKLRNGDYRVIYTLTDEDVLVVRIRHRSKAYG